MGGWSWLSSCSVDTVDKKGSGWRDGTTANVHEVSLSIIHDTPSAFQSPQTATQAGFTWQLSCVPCQATLLSLRAEASDVLGNPGQVVTPFCTPVSSSLKQRDPPGPSFLWADGPSVARALFTFTCGLHSHLPGESTGPAVVAEIQLTGLLEPGTLGSLGWPGSGPCRQPCSGPPATAAAAQRMGHSGTMTAGPAVAATHAQRPASLPGLAHSLCSQKGVWCLATCCPAAKEKRISTPTFGGLASLNTVAYR